MNERNIHTMVVATKLVAEGKCQNLEEAVSKIECGICHGKYHVQADCRKNNQYPNPTSSSSNKERDVMMIHQAFSTIDNYNPNGNIVCMLSDIQDTHTVTMRQLNSTRYNIDNHCNVIIYNNKDFVNNIQPVDVIVNGYGGTSKLKYTCNHNIFGPGYYDPTSPYNLLGLKPLEKMGFIEYKPKEANNEYTYLAHQIYGDIKFERTNSDFYTISHDNLVRTIQSRISKEQYRQPEDTPRMQRLDTNQQIICPVIAELQDEYTDDQYRRAEETFRLHRRLGHPSNKKLTTILNNNLIVNTILTSHDVIRMIDIFGPCETCNTVKPIKIVNQHPTFTPTDTNIGEIMHMDIVYVTKSIVFLLTVESTTNYLRAYRVIKKSDIENQISSMIAYAQLRGFTIKKIRPDSEFVLISQALRDKLATHRIDINASIPLEHEKLAESNMSRIRIKMKCIAYELKYIIPIMFLPYLFYHAIDMLNMVPNDKIKTSSPAQRYDGHKPNFLTDITIEFGSPCIVQNTADIDTITAKQVVAIALGRSQIHIGGIFVWIPGSTKIVVRRVLKYTKLTTSMIAAIHTLEPAGDDLVINSNKTHRVDQSNTIYDDNNHLIDNNSHIESGDDNTHDNNSHHRLNNNIMDNQQIDNNSHTTNRTRQYKRQQEQDIMSNSAADKVQKITIADDNTHTMRTRSRKEIFSLLAQEYTTTQIEFKHYVDNLRTIAADYDELKQILNFGTFKFLTYLTDREQSIHNKILPAHMVRTVKYNKGKYVKHKSRLTAGGNHAEIINYTINSTSAPTVSQETLMVQLTIAVTKQYKIASVDYQAAFLNARSKAGEKHVMRINKKEALILCTIDQKLKQYLQHDGTFLVQLEKTLYGLPEAGKCWFTLLSTLLIEMGFTQCIQEPTLFKKHTDIITIHVDDLLLTYSNNLDQQIMTYFTKKNIPLKIQHLTVDNPLEHLGVVIELQLDGSLALSQIHYIETSIIDEYKPTHTYVTPAINSNHSIIEDHNQLNTTTNQPLTPMPIDKESYLKKLMRLYYVAARTRPDILTACSYASVITNPTTDDDLKLDRIIGYLLKTKHLKLHINKTDLELFAEFDAAFATHEDFKSHSGKIIFLGHIPVCFKSNKQKMNTKPSAHAELNALYEGLDVLLWLRAVLTFLIPDFINDIQPLKVYQDNTSTIKIAQLGRASTKSNSRYINCRTFWIKDLIETNQINVQYLPSDQIVPDALASIRTGADFTTFRSNMQVYDLESII